MKKISSTNSTSMKLIRLISGSSRRRGRRFKGSALGDEPVAFVEGIHQLHRLLFHLDDEPLHLAAEVAVGDQRRYRDGEAGGRGDQRLADAAGEDPRIAEAVGRDGVEG